MSDALEYSESSFWEKLKGYAKAAGYGLVKIALELYYAAQRPETPIWAKTVIFGALAYFISPVDAIPDLVPVVGYADDLGALTAALSTVAAYIDENVKQLAAEKVKDWFGD